jgi:hypothetical protein
MLPAQLQQARRSRKVPNTLSPAASQGNRGGATPHVITSDFCVKVRSAAAESGTAPSTYSISTTDYAHHSRSRLSAIPDIAVQTPLLIVPLDPDNKIFHLHQPRVRFQVRFPYFEGRISMHLELQSAECDARDVE